jgi:GTPase
MTDHQCCADPDYLKVGLSLLFQEGRTKGIVKITQVFPLQQD